MDYEDIRYEIVDGPAAVVTINRPDRYNAFRGQTVEELITRLPCAWADSAVRAVILTGAGDKAFCTGGDVKQRAETGDYGPTESGLFEIDYLHRLIRDIPKPVIAAVNGVAIGGGHVLHVAVRPLDRGETAPASARPGRAVGSFDAGFGTAYLARVVGREAGPRDLVPVPPVRRRGRPSAGASSTRSCPTARPCAEAQAWARRSRR